MNALGRIDPRAVLALARADLPRPLDVVNLIHLRDERSYARYGVTVLPLMLAAGASLRWMGHHERSLRGESQAERLMLVRYPSHRRFLAMTLNPYYLAINAFRERGVRAFEASFTHPHERNLRGQGRLLVAHFNDPTTLDELCDALEPVGPLVYATHEVASASYLRGRRPTDPNPLTYKRIACFAAPEECELPVDALDGIAIQLYRRANPRGLLAKSL